MIVKRLSIEKTPYAVKWRSRAAEEFGKDVASEVMARMNARYEQFCQEHARESAGIREHTEKRLFPVIALYQTLLEYTSQVHAVELLEQWFYEVVKQQINAMKEYINSQNMVRQFQVFFAEEMEKSYSEEAGFVGKFLHRDANCVEMQVTSCLYLRFTTYYGCPEICHCFCKTDDMCYEDIHPKIIWERSHTLAEGKEYCDFTIRLARIEE